MTRPRITILVGATEPLDRVVAWELSDDPQRPERAWYAAVAPPGPLNTDLSYQFGKTYAKRGPWEDLPLVQAYAGQQSLPIEATDIDGPHRPRDLIEVHTPDTASFSVFLEGFTHGFRAYLQPHMLR